MNKNYLLFAIVATALVIPVGFAVANVYFSATQQAVAVDGDSGFDELSEVSSVATWQNTTDSSHYAVVTGFGDDSITVIDVSNPNAISEMSTSGACTPPSTKDTTNVCNTLGNHGSQLGGARDIEVFTNTNGTFGVVASHFDDAIQIVDLTASKSQIYTLLNYTAGGAGYDYGSVALDGAYDVAIFDNSTTAGAAPMAIVASNISDGVQVFNLRNFHGDDDEDTKFLYAGLNRTADGRLFAPGASAPAGDRMPLDGASGVATFTATSKATSGGTVPFAIVTAFDDDAIQVLTLRDPMNSTNVNTYGKMAGTGYYNAAGIRAPLNATGVSPYSNATDGTGDGGYNLLDGAIDVDTWTYGDQVYGIVVAQNDNSFIIINLTDPTFSTGGISAAQLFNTTDSSSYPALDGANSVDVFKIDARPYALITSNDTDNGVSLVDLYQPSNPQPVLVVRDDIEGFTSLNGANDVTHLFTNGYHYAIVAAGGGGGGATSTSASAITMVQLSGERPTTSSPICGLTADCSAPSITKHGSTPTTDGFSINGDNIANQDKYNDVDTVTAKVGQLVNFKARVHDDFSINSIERVILYFDMQGAPDWSYSNASIKYDVKSGMVSVTDPNNLFEGDVSAKVSENPYGDDPQLAFQDVTFKVMFNNPMDASHLAVQSIDDMNNYQIIYFKDALEVTGTPTQTAGDETIEGEVTQTVATVPGWVKNTAGWWADGQISEGEFVKGVEYLIQQQIIDTDVQTSTSTGTGSAVPDWVKNTAGWWADGQISEGEFVNAIEHLVKTGTIIII